MPAIKSNIKSKSRVATKAKKNNPQLKWWIGLGLVVLVAVVGVIVVRNSQAFGEDIDITWSNYLKEGSGLSLSYNGATCIRLNHDSQQWCHFGIRNQNIPMWVRMDPKDGKCATIVPIWGSKRNAVDWVKQYGSERGFDKGESVRITEFKQGYGKSCISPNNAAGNQVPYRN